MDGKPYVGQSAHRPVGLVPSSISITDVWVNDFLMNGIIIVVDG